MADGAEEGIGSERPTTQEAVRLRVSRNATNNKWVRAAFLRALVERGPQTPGGLNLSSPSVAAFGGPLVAGFRVPTVEK